MRSCLMQDVIRDTMLLPSEAIEAGLLIMEPSIGSNCRVVASLSPM